MAPLPGDQLKGGNAMRLCLTSFVLAGLWCLAYGRADPEHAVALKAPHAGQLPPPVRPNPIKQAVFSPDGSQLLAIETQGMVHLWDVAKREKLWSGRVQWNGIEVTALESACFLAEGKLVALTVQSALMIWDPQSHKTVASFGGETKEENRRRWFDQILVTRDVNRIISIGSSWVMGDNVKQDIEIGEWDLRKKVPERLLRFPAPVVLHCEAVAGALSADGKTVFGVMYSEKERKDFLIQLDLPEGKMSAGVFLAPMSPIHFFPDGKRFSGISADGFQVYSVPDLKKLEVHSGPQKAGRLIGFSPDGKKLVSVRDLRFADMQGGQDAEKMLAAANWDVTLTGIDPSQQLWQTKIGKTTAFSVTAFSPDGKLLLVGGCQPAYVSDWGHGRCDPALLMFASDSGKHLATLLGK
jgi:WD40 repeat protein